MKIKIGTLIKYWLPVILWAAVIFYLSAVPNLKTELPSIWDLILRKAAHIAEYAVLAILLLRAINQKTQKIGWKSILLAFILCFGYALSDEYHQLFVAGRHGSLIDAGIDGGGIIVGLLVGRFLIGRAS